MIIITRQEAKSQGFKKYFTGKPCKRGHIAERWVCKCCCIDCEKLQRNVYDEKYRDNHRDYIEKYQKEHQKERSKYMNIRYNTNIQHRLAHQLRSRIRSAVNGEYKFGSAVNDLGCSIDEFKLYLESKFRDGMNWENQGSYWHIDHIKPLVSYDLTNREQFLEACNYTNMQPLLSEENWKKSAKINWVRE